MQGFAGFGVPRPIGSERQRRQAAEFAHRSLAGMAAKPDCGLSRLIQVVAVHFFIIRWKRRLIIRHEKQIHGWQRSAFLADPSWSIPPTLFLLKLHWVDFMKMVPDADCSRRIYA